MIDFIMYFNDRFTYFMIKLIKRKVYWWRDGHTQVL